jgi:hypothetical protein
VLFGSAEEAQYRETLNFIVSLHSVAMEKNVGGWDRMVRFVAGPILVAVAVAVLAGGLDIGITGVVGLAITALLLVAGGIFLVTGMTQKCPANKVAGINTCKTDR